MYARIKEVFSKVVEANNLWNEMVKVKAKVLTPNEAIGNPERPDFPLFKGKERIVQAEFKGAYGQAFTDMYCDYEGTGLEVWCGGWDPSPNLPVNLMPSLKTL